MMAPTISYTREDVYQHEALTKLLRLEELDVVREEVESATNTIKLYCKHRWFVALCPDCGQLTSPNVGGGKGGAVNYLGPRMVVDAPIRERHLRLLFDELQLSCAACGSTFVKPVSDVVPDADYTYRLLTEVANAPQALHPPLAPRAPRALGEGGKRGKGHPEREVELLVSRYGLTVEMAESILKAVKDKRHLEVKQPVSVRALGLDEVLDPNGRFDYALVISDLEQRRVLDVLPDQTKLNLIAWLNSPPVGISLSELARVRVARQPLGNVIVENHPQVLIESPSADARGREGERAKGQGASPPELGGTEGGRARGRGRAKGESTQSTGSLAQERLDMRADKSTLWDLESEPSHERYRPSHTRVIEPPPTEDEEDEPDRYQVTVAFLIAVVTLVAAILAWRTGFSAGNATEADFAGLYATLNAQQTESLNKAEVLRHSRAYMDYTRHNQEQALLEDAGAEGNQELRREQNEAINLATTNQFFFPQRYLERDGSYNAPRQEAEIWAQAAQNLDLEPEPHIAEAMSARQETKWLVAIFIPLSISLLFYTMAEALEPSQRKLRMVTAIAGTLFLIGTIGATIVIEFF